MRSKHPAKWVLGITSLAVLAVVAMALAWEWLGSGSDPKKEKQLMDFMEIAQSHRDANEAIAFLKRNRIPYSRCINKCESTAEKIPEGADYEIQTYFSDLSHGPLVSHGVLARLSVHQQRIVDAKFTSGNTGP